MIQNRKKLKHSQTDSSGSQSLSVSTQ